MEDESKNEIFENCIFSGKLNEVKKMIDLGVDLDKPSSINGMTPLILAIEGDQPLILELLLENGANPNKKCNISGLTPLHWAVDYATDGMWQNNRDTPYSEPIECIRILLSYGADMNIKDDQGKTVLDYPMTEDIKNKLKPNKIV